LKKYNKFTSLRCGVAERPFILNYTKKRMPEESFTAVVPRDASQAAPPLR
jgi:hypothetical protein